MEQSKVIILLSIYNGASYLEDFLTSLERQTYKNWDLIIRDDGSSDDTLLILQRYIEHSKRISILENRQNLGVKGSFLCLMNEVLERSYEYIMFADQDDVWHKDKVEKTYRKIQDLEGCYGNEMPLLVHGDLTVVDKNLKVISPSFWKYQDVNPNKQKLSDFIVANNITGCTMMINRALVEKVKIIPKEAIMHDWWIAMVASIFGKIAYINEPLMLYRQHGKNDTGAKQYGMRYFVKQFFARPSFQKYIQQSKVFLLIYSNELDTYHRQMLEEFSFFDTLNKWKKLKVLFKYKIWKNGFMRNLGLILFS